MVRQSKRDAILLAAEQLLREKRIHELTMDDVAEMASVSKGTIYNHFTNKDDLLFQLATNGFDELCQVVAETPKNKPFDERLVSLCEHISGFFEERHTILHMIHEHEHRFGKMDASRKEYWREHRRCLSDAVASVIAQGVSEGFVRTDIRLDILATMLMGMLGARGRDYAHAPENRPPLRILVDIFLRGATAQTPDHPGNATIPPSARNHA